MAVRTALKNDFKKIHTVGSNGRRETVGGVQNALSCVLGPLRADGGAFARMTRRGTTFGAAVGLPSEVIASHRPHPRRVITSSVPTFYLLSSIHSDSVGGIKEAKYTPPDDPPPAHREALREHFGGLASLLKGTSAVPAPPTAASTLPKLGPRTLHFSAQSFTHRATAAPRKLNINRKKIPIRQMEVHMLR